MAFTATNPPKLAGDYTRFAPVRSTTLPPSTGATVAVVFANDNGPLKVPTLVESFAQYLDVFGRPLDPLNPPEGYVAAYNAFKGGGADDPGAGAMLCLRWSGAGATKASKVLAAGATPSALVLTYDYEGTRGNNYRVAVVANATLPATQVDVILYDGTEKVAEFKGYGSADIVALQTLINISAVPFTASGATNGTKLDALASSAFTGGANGAAMTAGDWVGAGSATEMLEAQRFGYFVPANMTDIAIRASLESWTRNLNAKERSKRFSMVVGGALAENFATASTRSTSAADENIVNWGVGSYRDTDLKLVLSTAQLAPRLAGVMSARGGRASISFVYLDDLEIVAGPSESDTLSAMTLGVVVVGLGAGGVRFERGLTTYTADTTAKPFNIYSRIKFVATMQNFERDGKEQNENGTVLGALTVNDDVREFIVGKEQARLNEYILRKEVLAGARVLLTTDPPPTDQDEHIAVDWLGSFQRGLEQIRRTIYFS